MFQALKDSSIESSTFTSTSPDILLADKALESYALHEEIVKDQAIIRESLATVDDLLNLYAAIESHGLSVSLLSFANTGNRLNQAIPEIPSLESMTEEMSEEPRQSALAGIGQKVKELLVKIVDKIKSVYNKVVSAIKLRSGSIGELRNQLTRITTEVHGKTFNSEEFSKLHTKLMRYEQLTELLDIAIGANALAFDLIKLKLPESEDESYHYESEFDKTLMRHIGHYSVVHNGEIVPPKMINASFHDMGYTEQSFHEISAKLEAYIHEELTNTPRMESELETKRNEACKRIEDLCATVSTSSGMTYRQQSRAAYLYENAFYDLSETIETITYNGWVHGARNGLRILGSFAKVYK